MKQIQQIPGTVDTHIHQRLDLPTVSLQMDRTQLQTLGLSANDVAQNLLATTAGTRLKATHIFAPSKFTNFVEAWGTTIGGPVWSPELDDNRLPIRSEGDLYGEGYAGYIVSQLAVFSDDNLPDYGTTSNYQVLISRPDTVLLFRSEPVFYVWPETYANTLDAALGARVYTACVPRWPEGTATLTGAFYKASTFA